VSWWFEKVPATRLAAVRILVGGFAAGYVLARLPHLLSYARFNPDLFEPVGVVSVLGVPLPAVLVYVLTIATAATGIAFALGYKFRVIGPVFAALLLWTLSYRNSWRMIFHTENLLVLHVIILGLAPSADAWSLDARGRASPKPDGAYGWPLRAMAVVAVVAYLLAGIAKFRWGTVGWLDGEVLRNLVATDTVRKMLLGSFYSPVASTMVEWSWAFTAFAIGTVVLECGAPLALIGRRAAAVWCLSAIAFHWGVQLIMMITFPYPMFGFAFVCFFPVDDWYRAWRERRKSKT
jgi:uncharacterized membrane protein YphA (DoxX/SURF4 family)